MFSQQTLELVECPRDAMQGWANLIPTPEKIEYLQALLKVGFHTLDFGSFVSPRAIPQMADTVEVLEALDLTETNTRLLAIVANMRGANSACQYASIDFLGYPFSVSETFQRRNTNSGIEESFELVEQMNALVDKQGKKLVVYLSMGFGNPYGDPYSEEVVLDWIDKISRAGVSIISLADTVGLASPIQVKSLCSKVIAAFPGITTGVHLHANPLGWKEKIEAAVEAGCTRIDSALKGIGGCPMANDTLVGNIDTEELVNYLDSINKTPVLNRAALEVASRIADRVFQ